MAMMMGLKRAIRAAKIEKQKYIIAMRKFNLAKKKGLNPTAPIKPDSVKNAR